MKHWLSGILIFLLFQSFAFSKDHNVLAFGALPDGKTLCTMSIQAAIDAAHADGGGRVVLPAGRFLSGTIVLASGVELHLEKNAVLLGSTDIDHYLKINRWKALVMADGARSIAISGKGSIDGQGAELALKIDSLFYIGQIDSAQYSLPERRPIAPLRPQLVEFVNCKNVSVTGITLRNAASWVQSYDLCTNLLIDGISVDSDAYWNNDGIDVTDSKNVRITNCTINASDDGICLKSYRVDRVNLCDSIYIGNCTVRSSASAVKLGTASYNGFTNVLIENIKVYDTFRSAIALELVDGGKMENIVVQNIKAVNTGNAIFIRLGMKRKKGDVGTLKNVLIKNVKCEVPWDRPDGAYEIRGPAEPFFHNVFPSSITGIPGHPVENVRLENIEIIYPGRGNPAYANLPISRLDGVPEQIDKYPEFSMFGELPAWGFYVRHVEGLSMKNVKLKIKAPDYRPALVFDDVKGLDINGLKIEGDEKANTVVEKDVER